MPDDDSVGGGTSFSLPVLFGLLGLLILLILLLRSVRFVVTQFVRKPYNLHHRYDGAAEVSRSWAVVTGASGGIGRGFAVELAKEGFNLCLISRSIERLENCASEVRHVNPNVLVKLIVADFRMAHDHVHLPIASYENPDRYQDDRDNSGDDEGGASGDYRAQAEVANPKKSGRRRRPSSSAFWDHLMCQIDEAVGDNVSILVNNVGINHTESFLTIPEDFLFDIVAINCTTELILTRRLINRMVARTQREGGKTRRSAVITVSSVAGQRPLLYLSPYSATKAFNDFFSRSMALEFGEKVDFLSLRPGYVTSNMSKLTEAGGFVLDRYECARGCLDKLGYVTETYGDPRHAVYARTFFMLPEKLLSIRRKRRLMEKAELSRCQGRNGDAVVDPENLVKTGDAPLDKFKAE